MNQTLTLVCKLNPSPEQSDAIQATLQAFADGCNFANETVNPSVTSAINIHHEAYYQIRKQFGLSANLAVRACARVASNRRAARAKKSKVHEFRPTSIDYDARIFAFREKDWTVSLTLTTGRAHIKLDIGNYQRGKLKGRKPTAATLCKHRDGKFYIHICIDDETAPIQPIKGMIGVDVGRRDIAVTSHGDSWTGGHLQATRERYARVRASLQRNASKGTRSTRRRARNILKRLSGREQRFQANINHTISKRIVTRAVAESAAISIENLHGIRERTNKKRTSKKNRREGNSWAFYQLRLFLEYKARKYGIELVAIPPAYTSQTCSNCMWLGDRNGKHFRCVNPACGWHGDADKNASANIALLGLKYVNQPKGSLIPDLTLACQLNRDDSGLFKAHTIAGTPA